MRPDARAAAPTPARPGRGRIRGLLLLPAALVALGLANIFGQRPSESAASSAAADLRVEAPAHLRSGLMFQVRVQVLAHRRLSHPTLVFSHAWFESMTQNSVNPQQAAGSSVGDRPSFEFSRSRPGIAPPTGSSSR